MIKSFLEMYELDISEYTSKRDEKGAVEYLPWNMCLYLLYKHGAERVTFEPLYDKHGHSVFLADVDPAKITAANGTRAKDPMCPEVHVRVTVDDKTGEIAYPLINGLEVITMGKINQQLVNTARQRAFTKCAAILTGLGLKLWEKEERDPAPSMDKEAHSIQVCANRIKEKYADALRRVGSEKELLKQIMVAGKPLTEGIMKNFMSYIGNAALIEHQIERAK